jgi:hypothetical protein
MHKKVLSLGALAAIPLAIATVASPASAHSEAAVPQRFLTPANDKEAHVPIWFTLQISGAEAASYF